MYLQYITMCCNVTLMLQVSADVPIYQMVILTFNVYLFTIYVLTRKKYKLLASALF